MRRAPQAIRDDCTGLSSWGLAFAPLSDMTSVVTRTSTYNAKQCKVQTRTKFITHYCAPDQQRCLLVALLGMVGSGGGFHLVAATAAFPRLECLKKSGKDPPDCCPQGWKAASRGKGTYICNFKFDFFWKKNLLIWKFVRCLLNYFLVFLISNDGFYAIKMKIQKGGWNLAWSKNNIRKLPRLNCRILRRGDSNPRRLYCHRRVILLRYHRWW